MSHRQRTPQASGVQLISQARQVKVGAWTTGRLYFWCAVIIGSIALWFVYVSSSRIVLAEHELARRDFRNALRLAFEELQADENSDRALIIAGLAYQTARDFSAARACFMRVSSRYPSLQSIAQRELSRILLDAGRVSESEELLRKSLQIVPNDPATIDLYIYLLTLEGRSWEARQLILDQLRAGIVTTNYLVIADAFHQSLNEPVEFAEHCLKAVPEDPLPRLILAHEAWRNHQLQVALEHLRLLLQRYPDLVDGHALLLQVLVETSTPDEFLQAVQNLPDRAVDHPEIWLAQGKWAENQSQFEAAARCYWESIRREPNLRTANYRLSQTLVSLKRPEFARPFAERAERLTALSLKTSGFSSGFDEQKLPSVVEELEQTGRVWEAAGWCRVLEQNGNIPPDWTRSTLSRLYPQLLSTHRFTSLTHDLSRQVDLSHYPMPIFRPIDGLLKNPSTVESSTNRISFRDDAPRSGLNFTFQNGGLSGDLESMLQMNGGGVAVVDYDGDLRPDLFFTQGGSLPPAPFDSAQSDQLFRNRGPDSARDSLSGTFENVSISAGIQDLGYGQGVTAGDFDNDGFQDLYVGNIGRNQFYRNNGDGTFSDVTALAGVDAGGWTSSCVLADFNHDSWPDLYVVTYLGGEAPYKYCSKKARKRCSPLDFEAQPDRFYLNRGDGSFTELTGTCGLEASEGRGLGVVAADFDGSGRLSLFVANDMSANFYFQNLTTDSKTLQFNEVGLLAGLAYDHLGQSKASMGVAAGDYNADGRLDLFVTTFYRQSNDLFTQQPDGTFRDLSREARLYDPSFLQLGWGTQFLDADLDRHPDLFVTNGHVHDPIDPTIPYQMSPQFFRNQGDATFAELSHKQLGEFHRGKHLGRALARLDWNCDGLVDVCISHINQPVALVTNRTESAGHFLAFHLIGVDSARDAIGTRVNIRSAGQELYGQLTAGDGFQASNERRLVFGLGSNLIVESVEVIWPSGSRQIFSNLKADQDWILIEHRTPVGLERR